MRTDSKTDHGNFFEDFELGRTLTHATPRTLTEGDRAFYQALYGSRYALQSSDAFARACGLQAAPVDDWLVFHTAFGKSVPDVSLNAVANLGYAEGRWLAPVYPGDTLSATSEVIGLRETSSGKTGVVYVRTTGRNQRGRDVLSFVRWVMVRKRDVTAHVAEEHVPEIAEAVEPADLVLPEGLDFRRYDTAAAGSPHRWSDYAIGEKIDHLDGQTVEEAEHQMATRLYQNTAKVHFDKRLGEEGPVGARLVYGGHVISLTRSLAFNGLGNTCLVLGLNAGRHANPCLAGDTVYAWSEVLDKAEAEGRDDVGFLRLRTVGVKNAAPTGFPDKDGEGNYPPEVVLDLDSWVALPR